MNRFVYDRDLRHEKINIMVDVLTKIATSHVIVTFFFLIHQTWRLKMHSMLNVILHLKSSDHTKSNINIMFKTWRASAKVANVEILLSQC